MKVDLSDHHRRSVRLKGYDYSQAGAYFITIVAWQRLMLFGKIENGGMQINRYGEIIQKWWNKIPEHFPNVETGAFIIMPNHVHGIIIITDGRGTVSVPHIVAKTQMDGIEQQGGGTPPLRNDAVGIEHQGEMTSPLQNDADGIEHQGGETPPLRWVRCITKLIRHLYDAKLRRCNYESTRLSL